MSNQEKANIINDFAEKLCIEIEEARLKYQRLTKESGDNYDEVMDIYFNGFKKLVREVEDVYNTACKNKKRLNRLV